MLVAYILAPLFATATVARKITTKYVLTSDEKLDGIVKLLAKEAANSESVGVRISSSDKTAGPLTYDWMENRNYETGLSYYEKVYVDQEFDDYTADEDDITVKIQGPLTVGSKITVYCSGSNPFTRFAVQLLDQKNMPLYSGKVRFNVYFKPSNSIRYFTWDTKYYVWHEYLHADGFNGKEIIIGFEILQNSIQGTVFGGYPGNITQSSPCDAPAVVVIDKLDDPPVLHRLVYKKGN